MEIPTLENRYPTHLPDDGFRRCQPAPAADPALLLWNGDLAAELGMGTEWPDNPDAGRLWTGTELPGGSVPIALAYAGHQFGRPVPRLGDGRAVVLGQLTDRAGQRHDLQLKGSGPTPFSRGGDGRAALGPVLREFVVSEAMHTLGIPTTRALAAATTGETVQRQFGPEPGAVLTRVAASHLRFGSFEYYAHRGDTAGLRCLADTAIRWHFPALRAQPAPMRYLALLRAVMERTAALVNEWLRVGFIHGVMNTDNMTLSGETLDYGPCAFMDHFRPDRVYSSVDRDGRYAWNQQPRMAHWNLVRLAECLLPLVDEEDDAAVEAAEAVLGEYADLFAIGHSHMLARKLGLAGTEDAPGGSGTVESELGERMLAFMARHGADFTNTWQLLLKAPPDDHDQRMRVREWFDHDEEVDAWMAEYGARLHALGIDEAVRVRRMTAANPVIIPRNHRVEMALEAAREGDLAPIRRLIDALRTPYRSPSGFPELTLPPEPREIVPATFCGT
ncbi:YdiU family protein [Spiribacter sp. 221]|uniref:protein adenylyltransferase SelO n=1 Tax=Spiribacter onubensis TaxID=3122420 RepID=UPI00349FA10B